MPSMSTATVIVMTSASMVPIHRRRGRLHVVKAAHVQQRLEGHFANRERKSLVLRLSDPDVDSVGTRLSTSLGGEARSLRTLLSLRSTIL